MVENEADRYIAAADFVQYVKELITSYGPDCVLNADQSGFQYEIHSGRTLRTRAGSFTAPNILVTASSSGKMKKGAPQGVGWRKFFFPHVGDRTVLVIDSWSTYKNTALLDAATPEGRHVQIVTVPPKTTPLCQPLDVFGFECGKPLSERSGTGLFRDDIQCELHLRNAALKLQSLVHNQFSSPRFGKCGKLGGHTQVF
ncbi:hypothetical protein BV898_17129 [Hypsibius exemplaris]|uniref:DDE-1 domain-containing protein n=1 Tax=Hypsibius exemplaris TaxID=2072580 RepID=A0A9X6RLR0_HYPEX|nr:hypothetical protein BV898_17129 [Hypsibius exemplaris]